MVAAIGREMNPGRMAYEALGVSGAFAVFVAGWTTANPTLYRAGLALQAVTGWPRWRITLAAGILTTAFSCFPAVFLKLLEYVALYGLVLMPVGAIVFAEHWIFPRLRIPRYRAEAEAALVNWRAAFVWGGTLVACYFMPIHLYFRWLPGYALALAGYVALALPRREG
jgi:purine-cytosine permease-like protein